MASSLDAHLAHRDEVGVEDADVHLPEPARAQLQAAAPKVLHPERLRAHTGDLIAAKQED